MRAAPRTDPSVRNYRTRLLPWVRGAEAHLREWVYVARDSEVSPSRGRSGAARHAAAGVRVEPAPRPACPELACGREGCRRWHSSPRRGAPAIPWALCTPYFCEIARRCSLLPVTHKRRRRRDVSVAASQALEYSDRIEVVPPVRDLALAEREHGDVPVGVPTLGAHNMPLGGVLEYHDTLGRVVVYSQIKAAVKNDHGAVGAVQLKPSNCGTAVDMPRVPGNCHHVVNGDVLCERSKKWPGPASPSRPCSMMRKHGSSAVKSARLAMGASAAGRCAFA